MRKFHQAWASAIERMNRELSETIEKEIEVDQREAMLKRPAMAATFLLHRGETEKVCWAGSEDSRFYGTSIELFSRYDLYKANALDRMCPEGQKRPNDSGLFDMKVNSWTWVQDGGYFYLRQETIDDLEDVRPIGSPTGRVLRGGSFDDRPLYIRSAYRYMLLLDNQRSKSKLEHRN